MRRWGKRRPIEPSSRFKRFCLSLVSYRPLAPLDFKKGPYCIKDNVEIDFAALVLQQVATASKSPGFSIDTAQLSSLQLLTLLQRR